MMKRFSLYSILLFFIVSACDENTRKKPSNLIKKDTMENIMYDIYLINAAKGVNKKLIENNNLLPEAYILNKYSIDSTQFADSNTYYALAPEEYKGILDNVKSRLETKKNHFDSIKKTEEDIKQRKRDSSVKARKKQKSKILKLDSIKNIPVKTLKSQPKKEINP